MPNVGPVSAVEGTVRATSKLNVRQGSPSVTAPVATKAEIGTVLAVRGVVRGDTVQGNPTWYAGVDDTYFWSGGTTALQWTSGNGGALAVRRRASGTIRQLDENTIRELYGAFDYTEGRGGRVVPAPTWVQQNIVAVPTPLLANVQFPTVQFHVKGRASLMRVFDAIQAAGLAERILTCGGTFVPRHKGWDATRGLSSHAWGIAIDLNVAWNGYGAEPVAAGRPGSLRELVPFFEAEGFAWGGYFEPQSICDGMHFELARTDI